MSAVWQHFKIPTAQSQRAMSVIWKFHEVVVTGPLTTPRTWSDALKINTPPHGTRRLLSSEIICHGWTPATKAAGQFEKKRLTSARLFLFLVRQDAFVLASGPTHAYRWGAQSWSCVTLLLANGDDWLMKGEGGNGIWTEWTSYFFCSL